MNTVFELIGAVLFIAITSAMFNKKTSDAMGNEIITLIVWGLAVYAIANVFWIHD